MQGSESKPMCCGDCAAVMENGHTCDVIPFSTDVNSRAIQRMHRKRQREECKRQIIIGVRQMLGLSDRQAEIVYVLANRRYKNAAEMMHLNHEMATNITAINTQQDGLKLLLAELDKLEADRA